jgi:hypothetical protein
MAAEAREPHVYLMNDTEVPFVDVQFPVPFRLWEPTTVVTDLMLSAVFYWASASLPAARAPVARSLRGLWRFFFAVVGTAPILGAVVHGLDTGEGLVWCLNLACIAVGTWTMESLSLIWLGKGRAAWWHTPLRVLFTLQVLACLYYIAFVSSAFIVIIVDYLPAQLPITVLHGVAACRGGKTTFGRRHAHASRLLTSGMVVLLAAAVIQAAGVAPHKWFNHNDLYHVVQMLSTYLLFLGAAESIRAIEDAGAAAGGGKKGGGKKRE